MYIYYVKCMYIDIQRKVYTYTYLFSAILCGVYVYISCEDICVCILTYRVSFTRIRIYVQGYLSIHISIHIQMQS